MAYAAVNVDFSDSVDGVSPHYGFPYDNEEFQSAIKLKSVDVLIRSLAIAFKNIETLGQGQINWVLDHNNKKFLIRFQTRHREGLDDDRTYAYDMGDGLEPFADNIECVDLSNGELLFRCLLPTPLFNKCCADAAALYRLKNTEPSETLFHVSIAMLETHRIQMSLPAHNSKAYQSEAAFFRLDCSHMYTKRVVMEAEAETRADRFEMEIAAQYYSVFIIMRQMIEYVGNEFPIPATNKNRAFSLKTPHNDNKSDYDNSSTASTAAKELSETKLDTTEPLSPAFEETLSREVAAAALQTAFDESGLSQRKFAKKLGIDHKSLALALNCGSTIDRVTELLETAGYALKTGLVRLEN